MPILLLFASPLTRALAISGTLAFGTGCGEAPSQDECTQWHAECVETCSSDSFEGCLWTCEAEYDDCLDEAEQASVRRAESAAAVAEVGVACLAVTLCSLESLGDEDGDGDGDDWSDPEPESDDWGQDWGEQSPLDEAEIASPELSDPPSDPPPDLPLPLPDER
ncbi:hypothetical protein DB30_02214 [Enhygromyxa salina]|uniref:Uncharacterized protein n=1 Tax=Enhygromyxa salina TaxID=215803 RepID=A0A0C1ZKF7_9BACT|nr:hypothetical protein [Enhygromyxa salina]KIG17999.1 hypothetical protein DB30_02214 [Enhygromyxa salina]